MIELPPPARQAITTQVRDGDVAELVAQSAGAVAMLFDKVLAHQAAPGAFPLPSDPRSLERRMLARMGSLAPESKALLAIAAQTRLRPGTTAAAVTARKQHYGFAGAIDPGRPQPLVSAARAIDLPPELQAPAQRAVRRLAPTPPLSPKRATDPNEPGEPDLPDPDPGPGGGRPPVRPPTMVPSDLQLKTTTVHLVDDTGEVGRDELAIAAVVMDPINRTTVLVPPIGLGDFKKGDNRGVDRTICRIPLLRGANAEQFFLVNLFLAEIDRGGFRAYVEDNAHLLSSELLDLGLTAGLTVLGGLLGFAGGAAVGGAIGGAITAAATAGIGSAAALALGLAGALVATAGIALAGAVAGLLVAMAIKSIARLAKDELFDPTNIGQFVLPGGGLGLAKTDTKRFNRPGARADVGLRWDVFVTAGTPTPPTPPAPPIPDPDQATADGFLRDRVENVVILTLENRSFDHMLGYLPTRGRPDVNGLLGTETNPLHDPPTLPLGPQVGTLNVHELAGTVFADDPPHSVGAVARQTGLEDAAQPRPPDEELMQGFVDMFASSKPDVLPSDVMGYYRPEHVPVFDFIARHFAICDRWFCSFPGNTWVNRTIAMTGRPGRRPDGELVTNNDMPRFAGVHVHTFFKELDKAGASWASYSQDIPSVRIVDSSYPDDPQHFKSMDDFLHDCAAGTLPKVSFLDPNWVDIGALDDAQFPTSDHDLNEIRFPFTANDDHPPTDIAHAQAMVATLLFAVMAGPQWGKMLFLVYYDEHGGFYDHVPPEPVPLPVNPGAPDFPADQFPPDELEGPFSLLGVRVPALVVSPWVQQGQVSTLLFDHCSLVKTILQRFCQTGGRIPNLGPRVAAARHLGFVLKGNGPRFMSATTTAATGVGPGRGKLPAGLRNDLLSRLGKRMVSAAGKPRLAHEPYELEQQIAQARQAVGRRRAPVRP